MPDRVRIGAHGRIIGLTDLGLGSPWTRGDPARADAWADLGDRPARPRRLAGDRDAVPTERIPSRLARLAPCIYWDRSTRPGLVHRLSRPSHERRRRHRARCEARPLVVDLARALSLAAHIDVALLRALRTRLFAESDVATEADLWSSVLVQSRGRGELVLRSDVRAALWQDLREQPALLRAHRDALTDVRGAAPPLLELEERLTFHALARDLGAIDRELRTVIAAMRDEPDRRRNLAAWSAQALDQLPAEVRDTEAARILATSRAHGSQPRCRSPS